MLSARCGSSFIITVRNANRFAVLIPIVGISERCRASQKIKIDADRKARGIKYGLIWYRAIRVSILPFCDSQFGRSEVGDKPPVGVSSALSLSCFQFSFILTDEFLLGWQTLP